MAVVTLDVSDWKEAFPTFKNASETQIDMCFDVATTIVDNGPHSPIPYDPPRIKDRRTILYYLTAHVLYLEAMYGVDVDGNSSSSPSSSSTSVQSGPTTSATEGSVSVGFDTSSSSGDSSGSNSSWYSQTPFGKTVLRLLRPYMVGGRYYAVRKVHPWG